MISREWSIAAQDRWLPLKGGITLQVPRLLQSNFQLRLNALAFMGKGRCCDSSFMQRRGNPEISKWVAKRQWAQLFSSCFYLRRNEKCSKTLINVYIFRGRVPVSLVYTLHNSSASLKVLKENECTHKQNVMFLGKWNHRVNLKLSTLYFNFLKKKIQGKKKVFSKFSRKTEKLLPLNFVLSTVGYKR